MSGKIVWLSGLAVALLGLGVARGQGPSNPAEPMTFLPLSAPPAGPPYSGPYATHDGNGAGGPWNGTNNGAVDGAAPPGGAPITAAARRSDWITYPRSPGCCGPVGGDGPIGYEMYVRTGVAFPIGSGLFGAVLSPGYAIEAGGRALFFNPAVDACWTIDLSVSNYNYNATDQTHTVPIFNIPARVTNAAGQTTSITVPEADVSVSGLNQTFVNAAFGREIYFVGSGDPQACTWSWRAGMDLGGRWGTAKVDLHELKHRTDVVGGVFMAVHTDIEIPCGCCIFQAGLRGEYNYIWSDILQSQNDTDLQSINLLFVLGARF